MAGSFKHGKEPSDSGTTELVSLATAGGVRSFYCGTWWWPGYLHGLLERVCTHKATLMTWPY